ncbi:2-oxoglutarate receptor 1-like [Salmo salar]|uniref:2-oxoglutarate receptor 1-like n=1 Tax=Salmo salar TaxID=8030 RepID=A0ABM3DNG5_SALSA|nr:2-oxoglutarate receptor 1-like [Salmo salar]
MVTDCFPVDEYSRRYYLQITYGIIFVLGLVGNITSIIIYVVRLRPWKSSSIIMVNLALADLLYILSPSWSTTTSRTTGSWATSCVPFSALALTSTCTLTLHYCKLHSIVELSTWNIFVGLSSYFNLYGSILFLTCLSEFHYVVVVHPLRAAQCLDFSSNDPGEVWVYAWLLTVLSYLLPLVGLCLATHSPELPTPPKYVYVYVSRVRARRLAVLILVVFLMCFILFYILRALRMYTRMEAKTLVPCILLRGVN